MSNTTKKSAADYAKNYKLISAPGVYGPITIGNIGEHNGRDLFNLCIRTFAYPDKNAVASAPKDFGWRERFATGDMVNIVVDEKGYVKKMSPVKVKSVTSSAASTIEAQPEAQPETEKTPALADSDEPAY